MNCLSDAYYYMFEPGSFLFRHFQLLSAIRTLVDDLNAPKSDAIFSVDVTPHFGYVHDEAIPLPQYLSWMLPVNTELQHTHWESRILWSDPEDATTDEDMEHAEGLNEKAKARLPVVLDLNDPAMVYGAGVIRPQRLWEVTMTQKKGKARIPNSKLEHVASVLSKQKLANQRGEKRFNISNDQVCI